MDPQGEISAAPGQPVVGLDYDGVLNIVGFPPDLPEGYEVHRVELDARNWPTHPYIRPLPPGRGPFVHPVIISRTHGAMVRSWIEAGALVVWATTWERAVLANASLSDVPELPVLEISRVVGEPHPHRTADWKVLGLRTAFAGHPLVWVDDFANQIRHESTYGEPPAPWLAVAPDETVGLTAHDSERVVEFIRRHLP